MLLRRGAGLRLIRSWLLVNGVDMADKYAWGARAPQHGDAIDFLLGKCNSKELTAQFFASIAAPLHAGSILLQQFQ